MELYSENDNYKLYQGNIELNKEYLDISKARIEHAKKK